MADPKLVRDWLFAAERGDLATLKRLLTAEPGLVDTLGQGPYWEGSFRLLAQGASTTGDPSPLPGAVAGGDRTIIKQLLEVGADPNAFGAHGYAALHAATIHGNLAMIRMVLSTGASLDLKDNEHHSTPVGWAAYHKHPRVVAFLKARGGV